MKRLIISDIHANLAGLDAVLDHEGRWDELIFLGDAIGAGPQPEQVVQRLAALEGLSIVGNHDLEPFRRPVRDDDTRPDRVYMRWTRDQVSPGGRAFLESLERTRVIERDGMTIRLHHGDFKKPPGAGSSLGHRVLRGLQARLFGIRWDSRIWPDAHPRVFRQIAKRFPEPYILLAHSHIQFRLEVDGTTFINPGSVGQPRLGQPLATYATIEDGAFHLKAVPYDVEATCRALDQVPLDRDFIDDWKAGYRAGRLPARYRIRDWEPLISQGYR